MTKLLFGVHMHQPVDNLGVAVKRAIELSYAPFFELMSSYPEFRFTLHSSGWIFEYIRENYPSIFKNIQKCNIEVITGGYYEPILNSIDRKSQLNQIRKLSQFIEDNFSQTPKGLWLTERVWSDEIISTLSELGIEYLIVDDEHIYRANKRKIEGFYTSEFGGDRVSIFPINKELRYKIPFAEARDSINKVKEYKSAIIFDDLEKFGLWPKTYSWVYEKEWLKDFVEMALDEVETLHFKQYHAENSSLGLIYLPESSYSEMNGWAGGKWKNFFLKYSESNRIHKRMLEFKELQSEPLFKAQTNDVFWHGAFGGIYLPNLRDNAYSYIIECEESTPNGTFIQDIELIGSPQLKLKTPHMIARFSSRGGALIEFDDRGSKFNFQNTLTRRREEYHKGVQGEQKSEEIATIHDMEHSIPEEKLQFDSYEKVSFIDLIANEKGEVRGFANTIFEIDGTTFTTDGIRKHYVPLENGFEFKNSLKFNGEWNYILELNLHFAHYDDLVLNGDLISGAGDTLYGSKFIFQDSFTQSKIIIEFQREMRLSYSLIETVSQSEKGIDTIIQGINLNFEVEFQNSLELEGRFLCLK